jgi:hypothetical protein
MGPVPPNSAVPATTEATHAAAPNRKYGPRSVPEESDSKENVAGTLLARAPGGRPQRRHDCIRFIPVLSSIFPRKENAAPGCTGCIDYWVP